jgi:hypothetical protein
MVDILNTDNTTLDDQDRKMYEYYSGVLGGSWKTSIDLAVDIPGLNIEIALARSQVRSLLQKDPNNYKEVRSSILALERLVRTRYYIGKHDSQRLAERVAVILNNIDLPEGITHAGLRK